MNEYQALFTFIIWYGRLVQVFGVGHGRNVNNYLLNIISICITFILIGLGTLKRRWWSLRRLLFVCVKIPLILLLGHYHLLTILLFNRQGRIVWVRDVFAVVLFGWRVLREVRFHFRRRSEIRIGDLRLRYFGTLNPLRQWPKLALTAGLALLFDEIGNARRLPSLLLHKIEAKSLLRWVVFVRRGVFLQRARLAAVEVFFWRVGAHGAAVRVSHLMYANFDEINYFLIYCFNLIHEIMNRFYW